MDNSGCFMICCSIVTLLLADGYLFQTAGVGNLIIKPSERKQSLPQGKAFVLSCQGLPDDPDLFTEMKWTGPKGVLREGRSGRTEVFRIGKALFLRFDSPSARDMGIYSCSAMYDSVHRLNSETELIFYEDITWEDCPERQILLENSLGKIKCKVSSEPPPQITWEKDNHPLTDRYEVQKDGIKVSAVSEEDKGKFSARAMVFETGRFKTRIINVRVEPTAMPIHRFAGTPCPYRSGEWKYLGGDFCYRVETKVTVNWMDAVYDCFQKGGSLASLSSSEEVKRILRYLKSYEKPLHIGLWKQSDGSYGWIDGSVLELKNWELQKNVHNDVCVAINTNTGKWNDIPCWKRYGYICTSLKKLPDPYAINPKKVCPKSATDWRDVGGDKCYFIQKRDKTTWRGALRACSNKGGSLASFHSIEEVSGVLHYHKEYNMQYNEELHIGLQQKDDGSTEWVDGSPLDFDNWNAGEPSDPNEKCGELLPVVGKWSDIPCDKVSGYVCSIPKDLADVPSPKSELQPRGRHRAKIVEGNEVFFATGMTLTLTCVVKDIAKRLAFIYWYHDITNVNYDLRRPVTITYKKHHYYVISTLIINDAQPKESGLYSCHPSEGDSFITTVHVLKDFSSPPNSCGGNISANNGAILSSNYPRNYPQNEDCFWKITVPENYRVGLNFKTVDIAYSDDCSFDYIEILDGHERGSSVLRKICGSEAPETLVTSRNQMGIRFVTTTPHGDKGFFAYFFKFELCGENIAAEKGEILSPNFPRIYFPNDLCTWKITVPEDFAVVLQFHCFDLEMSNNCMSDYVEVLDGHDATSPVLGRFCGSAGPSEIRSSGHKMTVKFLSDYSKEYTGFDAQFWKAEITSPGTFTQQTGDSCGGNIISENGVILSPNYPGEYSRNSKCTWRITIPDDYQIVLGFMSFKLEGISESTGECEYDYVVVRDGLDSTSPILGKFCGDAIPSNLTSSENTMSLEFVSDAGTQFDGFTAAFHKGNTTNSLIEAQLPTCNMTSRSLGCEYQTGELSGDVPVSEEGIVYNLRYPDTYQPNIKCIWGIAVPENHHVKMKFLSFQIERHHDCNYDYLKVLDGHQLNSPVLAKLCGYDIPEAIHTSGNKISIVFKTDSSIEYEGFSAVYEQDDGTVEPQERVNVCNESISRDSGTLRTPNYPGYYPPLQECIWHITVPRGQQVLLQFDKFDVERGKDCKYDFVKVLDGHEPSSPSLGMFCGQTNPGVVRSSGNEMLVTFVSDDFLERSGFLATFTKDVCGGDIVSDNGTVQSPIYSQARRLNEKCIWKITVPGNFRILFKIQRFEVPEYGDCNYNYVKILDGQESTSPPLERFCDAYDFKAVHSSGNKITVTFASKSLDENHGFSATFKKVELCREDIIASTGVIRSPNYPNDYGSNEDCEWKITVSKNHKVALNFSDVDVHSAVFCRNDVVKVYDGHEKKIRILGEVCRSKVPETIVSSGNKMMIVFESDDSVEKSGFSAEFTEVAA